MALQAHSGRISYRGQDRFDVTRKSGDVAGIPFAPSWTILRPALDARREADRLLAIANDPDVPMAQRADADQSAFHLMNEAWDDYLHAYLAEMRASYKANRAAWDALLARPRVVLVCYCTDAERCHRTVLRSVILPKLGAVDAGEVPA